MKREVNKTENCPFLEESTWDGSYGICNLPSESDPDFKCECEGFESPDCKLKACGPVLVCPVGSVASAHTQLGETHN